MKKILDKEVLEQLFLEAHSYNKFTDKQVSDETIHQLYDLLKWGPTAFNCQPGRYVFVKSQAGRELLLPALMSSNAEKVKTAPVTVIVATDLYFYEHLPTQWTAYDAKSLFADNQDLSVTAGFRNGTLEGAYLIMAARSLGLDAGPMSGFDNAMVDAAFFPDGRFKSNFLVSMGYGAEHGFYPRGARLPLEVAVRIV